MSTKAQFTFPDSAAIWINSYTCYDGPLFPNQWLCSVDKYCAPGEDTIINTITYSKLYQCNGPYEGAFKVDSNVVSYIPADSTTIYLLYDFGVDIGDTVENVWTNQGVEQSYVIDIQYDQYGRKNIYFFNWETYWIEGTGASQGFLNEVWGNVSGYIAQLYCVSEADSSLYPSPGGVPCDTTFGFNIGIEKVSKNRIEVYPNPAVDFIRVPMSIVSAEILTISGQRVLLMDNIEDEIRFDLPSGIYIISTLDESGNRYSTKLTVNRP